MDKINAAFLMKCGVYHLMKVGFGHLFSINQGDRCDGYAFFAAFESEPFGRGSLDGDRIDLDSVWAIFSRIRSMWGRNLGRCIEIVQSTFPIE